MYKQLFIDGAMTGPSHGDKIPGPWLPKADEYEDTARVEVNGRTEAQVRKDKAGREQIRRRSRHGYALSPWCWRDTKADEQYFYTYERCDGKGRIPL
jgi:hypothetical protein